MQPTSNPSGPFSSWRARQTRVKRPTSGRYSSNALGYEELQIDGRRAALATLPDNAKGLYVEINSAWVSIWSRGVSDEALRGLGRTLTADAPGTTTLPHRLCPRGCTRFDVAALQGRDFVSIDYAPSTNDGTSMYLSIAPAIATPIGYGEFVYEFTAVSVDGFSGFLGSRPTGDATTPTTDRLLLWRRDRLDFLLSGRGVTSDQILTAAASASPASPDEWAHLLAQRATPRRTTLAGYRTARGTRRHRTGPRRSARDRPITVTVDDVSNTEQQWSGVLPTGQPWSAKVTRVYDHIEMRSYSSDGTPLASLTGTIDQLIGGGQVTGCSPMAITKNPNATAIRVLFQRQPVHHPTARATRNRRTSRHCLHPHARRPHPHRTRRCNRQCPRVLRSSALRAPPWHEHAGPLFAIKPKSDHR